MSDPLLTIEEVELLLNDIESKLDRRASGPEPCVWLPLAVAAIGIGGWTQYLPRLRAIFTHHQTAWGNSYSFANAVEASIWFKDKIDNTVAAAFAHEKDSVVFGAVRGLDLALPGAEKALTKATRHPNSALVREAKGRLELLSPLPWWVGILSRDPAELVDADTLEAHAPTLVSLAEAMADPWFDVDDAWLDQVETLPPRLALDLFALQLKSRNGLWRKEKFWKLWWSLPGVLPQYLALLRTSRDAGIKYVLLHTHVGAEHPIWDELVTSVLTPEVFDRYPNPQDFYPDDVQWALHQLLHWPQGRDPGPLLALLDHLGLEHRSAKVLLMAVIQGGRGAEPWAEKAFEHFLRTGEWRPRGIFDSELCNVLPKETLQRYVDEASSATLPAVRLWRLRRLVASAEDEDALSDYLVNLLDDPEIGAKVAAQHGAQVYRTLRARLGRGELAAEMAPHLLRTHWFTTQEPFNPHEMAQLRTLRSADLAEAPTFLIHWPTLTPDDWAFYDGLVTQPEPPFALVDLFLAVFQRPRGATLDPEGIRCLERWGANSADRDAARFLDAILRR